MTRMIQFASKYLPVIAPFMAKNDIRYYLNGIYIEPHPKGGVVIVATNGQVLAAVHDISGYSNGKYICQLPDKIIAAAKKKRKGRSVIYPERVCFKGDVGYVTSSHADMETIDLISKFHFEACHAPAIDGKFPDWSQVVKIDNGGDSTFTVQLQYLRLLEPAVAASNYRGAGINVYASKKNANIFLVPGLPEFVAAVMPLHVEDEDVPNPAWINDIIGNVA